MAPKKQAKPNAFMEFVYELQQQRNIRSTEQAVSVAGPLWQNMNQQQRQRFKDRASHLKNAVAPGRYTSEGILVDDLVREENLKIQQEQQEKEEVKNLISASNSRDSLGSEVWFMIHFNTFCRHAATNRYYPAEIGVVKFTLLEGVKQENVFHYLIKSGDLPQGYKHEALLHSKETHELEIPLSSNSPDNQEEVYFKLLDFLEKNKAPGNRRLPIMFADKRHIEMVKSILDDWSGQFEGKTNLFKIYNLQSMFLTLRNTVAGGPIWETITISDREIEKDVYCHTPGLACKYHSVSSRPHFCSQSIVIRYAYMLCDNCCSDLNITLEQGSHVPLKSTISDNATTIRDSSSYCSSIRSSQFGSSRSRKGFESDTDSVADTWDSESVVSDTSTFTSGNNGSMFGGSSQGRSRTDSSVSHSASTLNSYASATVKTNLPSGFERKLTDLSLDSGSRRANNENVRPGASTGAIPKNFTSADSDDFPPLGRGKGKGRGRGRAVLAARLQRPGILSDHDD